MAHLGRKDPKLNEVKAVLQRLQGFPEEDGQPTGSPPPASNDAGASRRRTVVITAMILAQAAAIVGAALFVAYNRDDAQPLTASEPAGPRVVKAALEDARGLLAKGNVRAARLRLLTLAQQGSPDAAWDVARSYDPNVLATLPEADADPDIVEATRWYRTWYAAAVKEGLVADSVSIDRIIDSMKHAAQR